MNEHDEVPATDESAAAAPAGNAAAPPPPASGYGPPPVSGYEAPTWAPPTQQGPAGVPVGAPWTATVPSPQYPHPGGAPGYPYPPAPGPWDQDRYGAVPPAGGAVPPYGPAAGWMSTPPPGDPWPAPTGHRAPRRSRRQALTAGATAGVLAVAALGVLIGHAAWPTGSSTSSAAATSPVGGTGSGSTGSGATGSGATGSGSTGSGSTGSGSTGSGSTGFGSLPSGATGSTAGSASTAAGAPANAAAIAKKVDVGLVDINTTLGYQGEAAAGTGMVLTSTGEILTNNHVIDGATSIRVTDVANGKTYAATVVGYDRTQDVAVLQLAKASGLSTVTIGNSSSLTKAQAVVGIGNAGGAGGTPSYAAGSVTALGQSITASDEGGGNSEKLVGLIETNADIQAGDSGGSLVNVKGQVIGMDTAALSGTQFQAATTTTSYAIPINTAISLAKQIESGAATSTIHIGPTGLLGVEVEPAGQSTSVFGGTSTGSATSGAVIAGVVPSSPAATAGLATGDTITGVNGQKVTSPTALTNDLATDKPGTSVQLTYQDSTGQQHTATVQLASGPPQ